METMRRPAPERAHERPTGIDDPPEATVIDLTRRARHEEVAHDRRRASWAPGMPTVSVVVPTLNEARNLPHVLPEIPTWVDEVIIVDGRSTDDTLAVARRLLPGVRVVEEPEPGKGRALFAGMRAASGDIVVAIDADGSMDPHDIHRYVFTLMAGADFVKGSRFLHGGATDDMEWYRRLGNRALTELVRRIYGGRFSDLCYGYFALWRDTLGYLEGDAPGFEVETHINVRALAAGLRVVEVPTYEAERIHGSSNLNTVTDGLRVLRTIVRERNALRDTVLPVPRPPRRAVHPAVVKGAAVPTPERPPAPTVSAVVCTHDPDRWAALVRAVNSLQAQSVPPTEVLVVVDHHEELERRARAELAGVTVLASEGPKGLSGARNTAIDHAGGDIVAFLDDDAWADPDWVRCLLEPYEDPTVVAVGGTIAPHFAEGRPDWLPEEFDWVVGCTYRGLPEVRTPVRNLIGANMSFRRDALAAAGRFAHELGRVGSDGAGCEETELCIRLAAADPTAQIVYEPSARVRHEVPADRTTRAYFAKRCRAEGISKARVSRLAGSDAALAAERTYVARTLPAGVGRRLARLALLDAASARQLATMTTGLWLVATSYARGALASRGGAGR